MGKFYPCFVVLAIFLGFFVNVTRAQTPSSTGSGFAVTNDGWILTNAHVVDGCDRVEVGNFGKGEDIRVDSHNDLALIKLPAGVTTKPLYLRRDVIRLGEDIIALGFPLDGFLSDTIKMTTGNVSALSGIENDTRYLQISTPIQPGNSGGPVIDRNGHVIGISTAALSKNFADKTGFIAQNVNFAVRSTVAELFMQAQAISISFADDDKDVAPNLSTADIAESASPSVYKILCFASNHADNQQAPQQSTNTGRAADEAAMISQNNYDAIGFDYKTLKHQSFDECRNTCESETFCQAFTFNKRFHVCLLKTNVVALIRNKDAATGYRASQANNVILTNFTALSNMDLTGGDYARINHTSYIFCFTECVGDNRCRAFSFIPNKNECWLKDRLGEPRAKKGVELGVK